MTTNYFAVNQANWDDRAKIHVASGYGIERLLSSPDALSSVLAEDVPRFGDVAGQDVIHLQCHIGTDTIGFKRLGASRVVGVDLSGGSLEQARKIAAKCGAKVEFVQANVYDARQCVEGDFDLVYTSVGVLTWLPKIDEWAQVVASLMKPGGRFVIREAHPMAMAIGVDISHGYTVEFPYFEQDEPTTWNEATSYTNADGLTIEHRTYHEWSHGLGEIINALIKAGLVIDEVEELDGLSWNPWGDQMVEESEKYVLLKDREKLPLEFAIRAHKA